MSTDHAADIRQAVFDVSSVRAELSHFTHEQEKYALMDAEKSILRHVDALQAELDAERARVQRLQELCAAKQVISMQRGDLLMGIPVTQEDINATLNRHRTAIEACWEHGDLPDDDEVMT